MVNLPGSDEELIELVEFSGVVALPVLQDTIEAYTAASYGAEKWYLYLVDAAGIPRYVHYEIDLATERDRLLGEIATLVAE